MEKEIEQFEKDFREYLNASIAYAEIQEPYQALSSEDEIKWLKEYITKTLTETREKAVRETEERLFNNPLELFRGNRVKMSPQAREALLQAIDITTPDNTTKT